MWVETFSRKFGTNIAFIRKHRAFESVHVADVIGDVHGKHVIIYDDMIRSGSTLLNAVDEYLHKGALSVSAVVSHFALNNEGILDSLLRSPLKLIIATNSHSMSQLPRVKDHTDRIWILDASEVFSQALTNLVKTTSS